MGRGSQQTQNSPRKVGGSRAWDESKHPRVPKGQGDPSGEFAALAGPKMNAEFGHLGYAEKRGFLRKLADKNYARKLKGLPPLDDKKMLQALLKYKKSDAATQKIAYEHEKRIARIFGVDPTDDNLPLDAVFKVGRRTVGVEIKVRVNPDMVTLRVNMHSESRIRKEDWSIKHNAPVHTVAYDSITKTLYYREGVAAYRYKTMQVVTPAQLRRLVGLS